MKREKLFNRLPSQVKVGDSIYTIRYVDQVDKEDDLLGVTFLEQKKIRVLKKQTLDQIHSTLLHEIIHAVAHEFEFDLKEKKVRQLEKGLVKLFQHNKWKIIKAGLIDGENSKTVHKQKARNWKRTKPTT